MSSIIFFVTASPTSVARFNTKQTRDLNYPISINELTPPTPIYNRSFAASMDQQSGRGTIISKHEESTLRITYPITLKLQIQELFDSLSDYQTALFDVLDVDYMNEVRKFKLISTQIEKERKGCLHISATARLKWIR